MSFKPLLHVGTSIQNWEKTMTSSVWKYQLWFNDIASSLEYITQLTSKWINMEHWQNNNNRGKPKYLDEHLSQHHSDTNPTWPSMWLKLGLHNKRFVTKCLAWHDKQKKRCMIHVSQNKAQEMLIIRFRWKGLYYKWCTNLYIYAVWMVTLSTLCTGNKATLLIYTNSTTHDTNILGQNKLVFGWTQYKAILYPGFFFWLAEWWISLRSLEQNKLSGCEDELNTSQISNNVTKKPLLHYKQTISWKVNDSVLTMVKRYELT
jgi:hypothetical protein